MHRLKILAGAQALALLLVAGAALAVDTGSANFTTYVSFGDSLTAGYSSSALVRTYQVNSYPALIYRQATGLTTGFEQPLVSEPGISGLSVCRGSNPPAPCGILRLVSLVPSPVIAPTPGQGQPLNLALPRPYNNIAVPGATLHDLVSTTTGGFHDLVLRNQPGSAQPLTQLQEGLVLKPTFATLWIGNNDVLGAATSGIAIEGVTLTPVAQFDAEFRAAVNAISASAKMAIANLPDVTSIPFVTTISRLIINPQTSQPIIGPNGQPVALIGPNGPLQAGDFVLLSASADIAAGRGIPAGIGNGTGQPLADTQVLSAAEAARIKDYVNAYNNIIRTVATEKGAALVDANTVLNNLAARGIRVGGIPYTSAFLTGGIFSYDGVHPTAFGYAYLANLFIDAINGKFGADIPPVDLYPFVFGPLPKHGTVSSGASSLVDETNAGAYIDFVFTNDARRSLLLSLSVPKWIVDGTPAPRPRRRHGRG